MVRTNNKKFQEASIIPVSSTVHVLAEITNKQDLRRFKKLS
jgi:hypothetical protein